MLTIEMKINGTVIGQVYAHCQPTGERKAYYPYHCYIMDLGGGKPRIIEGGVHHYRPDGFLKLANLIYEDIDNHEVQ